MADERLRYPSGRAEEAMRTATRPASVAAIRVLPQRLAAAVAGLDAAQMEMPYRDGGWTVRQLVHHVADSHMNAGVRLRLALTEEWPPIKPYDQDGWVRLPDAMRVAPEVSLQLLTALHARWAVLAGWAERRAVEPGLCASGEWPDEH